MAVKGLREKTPLPSAVGRVERSPKMGSSDCQNNSISEKGTSAVFKIGGEMWVSWLRQGT